MVGSGFTLVAQMACKLSARHHWCVTGTPIGSGGLQDIFGALCVLHAHPLSEPAAFRCVASSPPIESGSLQDISAALCGYAATYD